MHMFSKCLEARIGLGFSADVQISLLSDSGDLKAGLQRPTQSAAQAYAVTEEHKLIDL